LRTPCSYSK